MFLIFMVSQFVFANESLATMITNMRLIDALVVDPEMKPAKISILFIVLIGRRVHFTTYVP